MVCFMDIMCIAIIDLIMQHYKKGHTSKIVRLLLIRPINNDILSTEMKLGDVGLTLKLVSQTFNPDTTYKNDSHPQTFVHFTSRTDWQAEDLTRDTSPILSWSGWDSLLLCAFLCCPVSLIMCIILVLGSVSSIRKPLSAAFSLCHTRWTHRWTQRRCIGRSAEPAASTSCFILSSLPV